jgi:oligoendopeptidase F
VLNDFHDIEPLYHALIERPIESPDALERFIADMSELWAFGDEEFQRLGIAKSCQTDDPALEAAFLKFVEEVEPGIKPLFFQLERQVLASPHLAALKQRDRRYAMFERKARASSELYRDENVPLQTETTKVVTEYEKTGGAMTVTFRGEEYTLSQMARFQEETDRATREEAWRLVVTRRLRDRETIESQFERLLALRDRIARNAGKCDFREYVWTMYERFDYTPNDTLRFADAIAECVVPLERELDRRRARDLGLEKLRPWDALVDVRGRPPLRPFA